MEREYIKYKDAELRLAVQCDYPFTPGRRYRGLHLHDEAELVYIVRGSIGCTIADRREPCALGTGDLLFINSNVLHRLCPAGKPAQIHLLQMNLSAFGIAPHGSGQPLFNAFQARNDAVSHRIMHPPETAMIGELIRRIEEESVQKKPGYKLFVQGAVFQLVALLTRANAFSPAEGGAAASASYRKILPVIDFIEKHYPERIVLSDLTALVNFDRYYLCRLFKQNSGGSIFDYINYVRLEKAKELLRAGGVPIAEIAAAVGFSSPQYFNRRFKEQNRCTPSQYRSLIVSNELSTL